MTSEIQIKAAGRHYETNTFPFPGGELQVQIPGLPEWPPIAQYADDYVVGGPRPQPKILRQEPRSSYYFFSLNTATNASSAARSSGVSAATVSERAAKRTASS